MMSIAQGSLSDVAAVVLGGRRARTTPELTKCVMESGAASATVIRSGGRRRGASESLVGDLLERGVTTVVVTSLAALHPSVASQLAILGALLTSGIRVVSVTDAWVSMVDPKTVAFIAGLLASDEHRRASRAGRSVVAQLRRAGTAVGRPRAALNVAPVDAQRLVAEQGWRRAARTIGTSPATLRRVLARAGLLPAPGRAA